MDAWLREGNEDEVRNDDTKKGCGKTNLNN